MVLGHRQRLNRFANAFISCENRLDFAEVGLYRRLFTCDFVTQGRYKKIKDAVTLLNPFSDAPRILLVRSVV